MTVLAEILIRHTGVGRAPGMVALIDRGGDIEFASAGVLELGQPEPMARDTIFRIASMTKPIMAAATLLMVEDDAISLDDPIMRWLPELAGPKVLASMGGPLDDVVPPNRAATVRDLLTSRAGHGFPSDFSLPVVGQVLALHEGPAGQPLIPPDEWLAALAQIPMLGQPGEVWLYNTPFDVLGLLLERASGLSLAQVLNERLFSPLGMADTGFAVPADRLPRLAAYYRADAELVDAPAGLWSAPPVFASGSGGLVSTVDDLLAFFRMLRGGGMLSAESIRLMTTDHLTAAQRAAGEMFLEGDGWGFGGSVDHAGRYGWMGGTGTAGHWDPATGDISILLSQLELSGPGTPDYIREFWAHASGPAGS